MDAIHLYGDVVVLDEISDESMFMPERPGRLYTTRGSGAACAMAFQCSINPLGVGWL